MRHCDRYAGKSFRHVVRGSQLVFGILERKQERYCDGPVTPFARCLHQPVKIGRVERLHNLPGGGNSLPGRERVLQRDQRCRLVPAD